MTTIRHRGQICTASVFEACIHKASTTLWQTHMFFAHSTYDIGEAQ
jgi:hypothetical protein